MFQLKYFSKIIARLKGAEKQPLVPEFDIDEFASSALWTRAAARMFELSVRGAFAFFRIFWPNPQFGRLVIVTRDSDVRQVLRQNEVFRVPFGEEMKELAGGAGSVLGLDGDQQEAQHQILAKVIRTEDLVRIRESTRSLANRQIEHSGGQLDVMKDFITRVATEVCAEYLGLEVDDPDIFAGYTIAISMLLFADPFGGERTYQLARRAAFNARRIVDQSIAQAKAGMRGDSITGRLVRLQGSDPTITDAVIRGNLMGLATGLIPTITLAAGKIFLEILRRPSAMTDAAEQASRQNAPGLRAILLEAARLNPALFPGQWRWAETSAVIAPGTLRSKHVRAGSILMVATASALRDWRPFPFPGRFTPGRKNYPDLIFGFGPHKCLGEQVALAQMEEMFGALFQEQNLRRCAGASGRLSSVGPFPRRLDVQFDTSVSPVLQSMLVFCIPVAQPNVARLKALLSTHGNPARGDAAKTLTASNIVHFASMSVIDAGSVEKPALFLILELNVDGSSDTAAKIIAKYCHGWLGPIFELTRAGTSDALEDLLKKPLDLKTLPWGTIGLNFNGTPEFPVFDIARQARLAAFVRSALKHYEENHFALGDRATVALRYVRGFIFQDKTFVDYAKGGGGQVKDRAHVARLLDEGRDFADFLIRPSRRRLLISDWSDRTNWQALVSFAASSSIKPLATATALTFLCSALAIFVFSGSLALPGRTLLALEYGFVATLVMTSAAILTFLGLLRWTETQDTSDDREATLAKAEEAYAIENHRDHVQNHFTAVTPLKSGWFRKLTLAFALWSIRQLVLHKYRPGFVLNMGTIHYARWFRIAGTEKLVFLSNFDGSWESYLEDFVMRAHAGQSAAWSNGVGFPRTEFLINGGAQDGDRFKRWVRRQQVPSQFWYSRFPKLTTNEIRNNAMIYDGLMRAQTENAARAWLDCFGSVPRPDYWIEANEVQSLVFRGLQDLIYAKCALVCLPSKAANARAWLGRLINCIRFSLQQDAGISGTEGVLAPLAFGDRSHESATFIGFSAAGLVKLGLSETDEDSGIATFPAAFRMGMSRRSKILGDFGASAPENWIWADRDRQDAGGADAILLVYAKSPEECDAVLDRHAHELGDRSAFIYELATSPASDKGLDFNHLGFRDGISQPVIKGTERFNQAAPPRDIVEPGEFILGYRNNQGYFPPTPTVSSESDVAHALSPVPAGSYSRFPQFASSPPNTRDFGRNGTFLVVRQLGLDVEGFEDLTRNNAGQLQKAIGAKTINGEEITADWIAAKMMGRKRNGTPLIPGASSTYFNDFSFGRDDPQGLSCPFGAHIRRANPRDSLEPLDPLQEEITNRHRLIRRGRSYVRRKADTGDEKGLLFMCVCADLERQFEFVQQSWIGSPVFHGLRNEVDPVAAPASHAWKTPKTPAEKSDDTNFKSASPDAPFGRESEAVSSAAPLTERVFTIPTLSGSIALDNMESVVTTRGGGYFFLPSLAAMRYLAGLS
jgi:Dyp-type peroxidase family